MIIQEIYNKAKQNWLKIAFSLIISVVPILVILKFANHDGIVVNMSEWSWADIGVAGCFFLTYQVLRSIRFNLVVKTTQNKSILFFTYCCHAGLNNLLPIGLAELMLVYLLKKIHRVDLISASLVVFTLRLIDVFVLCALLTIAYPFIVEFLPSSMIFAMTALAIAIVVLIATIIYFLRRGVGFFDKFGAISKYIQKLFDAIAVISDGFPIIWVVFLTFLQWVCMYFVLVFVLNGINFPLPMGQSLAIYMIQFPMDLLPLKGVANFGTHETAWFFILNLIGQGAKATYASFSSHFALLIISYSTGLIGLLGVLIAKYQISDKKGQIDEI